jgi:hypothetical protein
MQTKKIIIIIIIGDVGNNAGSNNGFINVNNILGMENLGINPGTIAGLDSLGEVKLLIGIKAMHRELFA